jgi:hypothetical protein
MKDSAVQQYQNRRQLLPGPASRDRPLQGPKQRQRQRRPPEKSRRPLQIQKQRQKQRQNQPQRQRRPAKAGRYKVNGNVNGLRFIKIY